VLAVDEATLIVLPDDPALGEFRAEFAGTLGVFLEFPQPRSATNPGFHDATEILGASAFWERRHASTEVMPDTQAFLRARLLDLFLNDWDRHQGQWRWARLPGYPRLQPIPEDADMALADYEGLALALARFLRAPYVTFEGRYSPIPAVAKNGWDVDRFLLTDIDRAQWMAVVMDVQAKLTDAVIEEAVGRLPPEFLELRRAEITSILKARRTNLAQFGERYYGWLAADVDVHATDTNDLAVAEWQDGGQLRVTVARLATDGSPMAPYFERRFDARDTDEVRLYLHGGDDRVIMRGRRSGDITVRAIGGPGDDVFDDSGGSGIRFYDSEGRNRVDGDGGTRLDAKPYTEAPRPEPNNLARVPNPDWGHVTTPIAVVSYSSDPGVLVGAGFDMHVRGFRAQPWGSRHAVEAAWAFGPSKPFLNYAGGIRRHNSNLEFTLNARFSGIEQLRYHGQGNETANDASSLDSSLSNYQTEVFPAVAVRTSRGNRFEVGPYFQYSDSTGTDGNTALGQERPLGSGTWGQAGLRAHAAFGSRQANVFSPGIVADATGKVFFKALDVDDEFGSLAGRVSAKIPTGERLLWSLDVGGKKVWGDYPYFEAAYIGHRTTPGYSWNRFAGDASMYGGVALDVVLKRLQSLVPAEVGVVAEANAGRVFLEGESSSKWHPSGAVGLFYAPFRRTSLYALSVGKTDEGWFYTMEVRMTGFGFQ
jgi:hypothetical protein